MSTKRWGGEASIKQGTPRMGRRGSRGGAPHSVSFKASEGASPADTWSGTAGLQGRDSKCLLFKLPSL